MSRGARGAEEAEGMFTDRTSGTGTDVPVRRGAAVPAGRRGPRRSDAALVPVAAVLLGAAALAVLPGPTPTLYVVSTLIREQSLVLVLTGLVVAVAATVALLRTGPRVRPVGMLAVAVVVTLVACLPAAGALRTARATGTAVTVSGYLDGTSLASGRAPAAVETLGTVDGTTLRADVWEPPGVLRPGRPAVVVVHGGSWESGYRSESPRWDEWLSATGATVVDIDYRLVPSAGWRDQPRDVACALAWLGARAGERGIDPERVVVMGSSAGAHLGLLAAYAPADFPSSCGGVPVRPAGVIGLYPPTSLAALDAADGWRYPEVVPHAALRAFMGGAPAYDPAAWSAASPADRVDGRSPPTLLLHGTGDQIVPVDQSRRLAQAGRERGADVELVELPFANHQYDLVWGGVNGQVGRDAMARFLARTVGGSAAG